MKKNKKLNLVKLSIKGLNQERILNALCKQFRLFNLDRVDRRNCSLEVENKNLKKAKSFLVAQGLEVEVLSSKKLFEFGKNAVKSYGIITAILLCFFVYAFQYQKIWAVKVYGVESLNQSEIVQFVDQNFDLNKNLKTKDVEIALKEKYFQISSVSVAIVGQSLIVNIYEKVIPDEMKGEFAPILSDFDGRITQTNLVQGTLAVKPGQIVRVGDVLVQPYIFDAQGQRREVKPQAEIFADVWISGQAQHSESQCVTYRTGNKISCDTISLFGLKIYSNAKQIDFKNYEIEHSTLQLTKNNILPLILQKDVYYEVTTDVIEQPFEQAREQKIDEARQKALIYLQEYDIIKEENCVIEERSGIFYVTYLLTINRKIGDTYENLLQKGISL